MRTAVCLVLTRVIEQMLTPPPPKSTDTLQIQSPGKYTAWAPQ